MKTEQEIRRELDRHQRKMRELVEKLAETERKREALVKQYLRPKKH